MADRTAQIATEVLAPQTAGSARTADIAAEVLSPPLPGTTRAAQIVVEVLHSLGALVTVTGGSGAWFKDLESDVKDDRDLVP